MNCPECRKHMWYWNALSLPNRGFLTYACQNCDLLFTFEKHTGPMLPALAAWRGMRVLRLELTKRGYLPPPPVYTEGECQRGPISRQS